MLSHSAVTTFVFSGYFKALNKTSQYFEGLLEKSMFGEKIHLLVFYFQNKKFSCKCSILA